MVNLAIFVTVYLAICGAVLPFKSNTPCLSINAGCLMQGLWWKPEICRESLSEFISSPCLISVISNI